MSEMQTVNPVYAENWLSKFVYKCVCNAFHLITTLFFILFTIILALNK